MYFQKTNLAFLSQWVLLVMGMRYAHLDYWFRLQLLVLSATAFLPPPTFTSLPDLLQLFDSPSSLSLLALFLNRWQHDSRSRAACLLSLVQLTYSRVPPFCYVHLHFAFPLKITIYTDFYSCIFIISRFVFVSLVLTSVASDWLYHLFECTKIKFYTNVK